MKLRTLIADVLNYSMIGRIIIVYGCDNNVM